MIKMIVGIISDARIDESFGTYSDFWKKIIEGAVCEAGKQNLEIKVFAPKETYNIKDFPSFLRNVCNSCDAIIMPFSQGSNKLIKILNDFKGPIVFINTPPLKKWKDKLNKKIPYVGINEFLAGQKIANILLEMGIIESIVVRHEEVDEGHDQRVLGIRSTKLKVKEIYINLEDHKGNKSLRTQSVLTLGTKGTLFALNNEIPIIVGMDCNSKVKEAFDYKRIKGILTQNPTKQGIEAIHLLSHLNLGDYLIEPMVYIN